MIDVSEETISKQQTEISQLNLKLSSAATTSTDYAQIEKVSSDMGALESDMGALENRLINFYTDNEKTCTEKKNILKLDLQVPLDRADKTATKALNLATQLRDNPPSVQCTLCPKPETITNIQSELDKLEHEIAGLQSTLNDLPLPNAETVGEKKQKKKPLYTFGKHDIVPDNSRKDADSKDEQKPSKHNLGDEQRPAKKIIMFMDSNRSFLDKSKLWKNLTLVPVGCLPELDKTILNYDLREYDVVIIHIGVNDIDNNSGMNVARRLIRLTSSIKTHAPGIKIILSEITPRQLTRDNEVVACNAELHETLGKAENVTLVNHSNLRNDEWTHHKKKDDKHINETSAARLAGNLKSAFRRAIGMMSGKNSPTKINGNQRGWDRSQHNPRDNRDNRNRPTSRDNRDSQDNRRGHQNNQPNKHHQHRNENYANDDDNSKTLPNNNKLRNIAEQLLQLLSNT